MYFKETNCYRFALKGILLLSVSIGMTSTSNAARISKGSETGCAVQLEGEIEPGDFEKISKLFAQLELNNQSEGGETENGEAEALCLNSTGGSYIVGRQISGLVHENAVPTRVRENAVCLSACANIFMAGRVRGDEMDYPSRTLEIGGKLGFHAPYLADNGQKTFTYEQVSELMAVQNLVVADLLQFASFRAIFDYRPAIPASLVASLYARGPSEVELVDTIDEVARWGIAVDGAKRTMKLTKRQTVQLCLNFQSWANDATAINNAKSLDFYVEMLKVEKASSSPEGKDYVIVDTGGMEAQFCQIEKTSTAVEYQSICVRDDFSGRHFGHCETDYSISVPSYYALPASTLLTDLK